MLNILQKKIQKTVVLFLIFVLLFIMMGFLAKAYKKKTLAKKEYGVFLSTDSSAMEQIKKYKTVVIDAQYFKKRDSESLHKNGTKVYTYLNIGSIENFRKYYTTYKKLAIGKYEHWDEEQWVNVASPDWQKFMTKLARGLYKKGIDGFFIDNCDVYYYAPRKSIFDGLTVILKNIMTFGKKVIINGGDTYVMKYKEHYGTINNIMTGINQETVWSCIDFDKGTFSEQKKQERDYFCKYLKACKADDVEVYLLEYTTSRKLTRKIEKYCKKHGYYFYISDSLELDWAWL